MTVADADAPNRSRQIDRFLADTGWSGAARKTLAGDASARRYERLSHPRFGPAVLMDADPAKGEDIRPFERIAHHLNGLGLSAPRCLHADAAHGLMLIEDLGDDLFARLTARDPALETPLYTAAIDVLAELHRHAPPADVPVFGPDEMAPLAALSAIWYAGDPPGLSPSTDAAQQVEATCHAVLTAAAPQTDVLVLRDYHAENLLWLPDRAGLARVGLLDFQDAGAGHPGYDVVSLLADARRDVTPALRDAMLRHYADTTGRDPGTFAAACAALSAQRNLRILGVFARLSLRDAKPGYVDLIPRVWAHLQRDLGHAVCAPLRAVILSLLPPPTPALLAGLRERAGTCPTR